MQSPYRIRHSIVVARLKKLQQDYADALERLADVKRYADWVNYEMAELWIEKATIERHTGPYETLN